MKFLIVGLVNNDQLSRLKDEAKKLDHEVDGCYAAELTIRAGRNNFDPTLCVSRWRNGSISLEEAVTCMAKQADESSSAPNGTDKLNLP